MAEFDIRLTKEAQKKIDQLAKSGKIDMRPTLKVIGIGYRKEVELIFDHQQPRAAGLRWPPLSPRYAARKAIEFPGAPILVRTGTLRRSMTIQGASGNIAAISKTSAVFGTSVPYGIYHDSDAPRKSNLPRRNFSEPSPGRIGIWKEQVKKDIIHNFTVNGIEVKEDKIFA